MSRGILDAYAGPMYAGKTSKLLQRVLWLNHQSKKVLVIKPAKDNRYSEDTITTHLDTLPSDAIFDSLSDEEKREKAEGMHGY